MIMIMILSLFFIIEKRFALVNAGGGPRPGEVDGFGSAPGRRGGAGPVATLQTRASRTSESLIIVICPSRL